MHLRGTVQYRWLNKSNKPEYRGVDTEPRLVHPVRMTETPRPREYLLRTNDGGAIEVVHEPCGFMLLYTQYIHLDSLVGLVRDHDLSHQ